MVNVGRRCGFCYIMWFDGLLSPLSYETMQPIFIKTFTNFEIY